MKELVSHIEFLILQHECVIIPNMGGFVLNKEHAYIHESGVILAPTVNVGFNADLRFNDGLLAESYMQKYGIPYDAAVRKIDEAVGQIKSELIARHEMPFGKMGVLKLNDGRIIYEPLLSCFTHPSVWGCSDVGLKRLCDLLAQPEAKHISRKWRRALVGVASTAAALALWVMMPAINDGMFQTIQQSGFFVQNTQQAAHSLEYTPIITTERDALLDEYAKNIAKQAAIQPVEEEQTEEIVSETKPVEKVKEQPKLVPVKVKRYYVIVGGDANKNAANKLLSKFKANGLQSVGIVDSPDRYRVYVATFNNKPEADAYLSRFRSKYPAYHDAWIFTKSTMEKGQ